MPLTAKDAGGRNFPVTVTDIGEGGIGISSKAELTVGKKFSFTLQLPRTSLPVHVQARIIWARGYGAPGCDFLSIPPID